MTAPVVKGWCPGALRPMMSGDGLVVRIRPRLARLPADTVLGLAEVARNYGSGVVDVTNRANLQIRGIAETDHWSVVEALDTLGVLDDEPEIESRRNILVAPNWTPGDLNERLAQDLAGRLRDFPALPRKFGFAVDCGADRRLSDAPADIRFERDTAGQLVLRADGAETGWNVPYSQAIDAAIELASWFAANRTEDLRRMAPLVRAVGLPTRFLGTSPVATAPPMTPGSRFDPDLRVLGVPFGQINASDLTELMVQSTSSALRITPHRLVLLEGGRMPAANGFVTISDDPRMDMDACPGAPLCPQASVATRPLALSLAGRVDGDIHVSGCAKGCARPRGAKVTLVGRDGAFDLVQNGAAWDEPTQRGLSLSQVLAEIGT